MIGDEIMQVVSGVLILVLVYFVWRYRSLFVTWILIVGTVQQAAGSDGGVRDTLLGIVLSVMLTIVLIRYMALVVRVRNLEFNAQTDALAETAETSVIATDLDGEVVSWSPQSERLFGIDGRTAIGKSVCSFFDEDSRRELRRLLGAVKDGKTHTADVAIVRKDGQRTVAARVTARPAMHGEKVIGMLLESSPAWRDTDAKK